MKWIPVEKARKLEFGKPVLAKDKDGYYWDAKLLKKEDTGNGNVFTFELAVFNDEHTETAATATNITHVAIP